jgi:multiple sugar transport system substrate-binding protein
MPAKRLYRRRFLQLGTVTAAGAALAACGPAATPVKVIETVEVPVQQTVVVEATQAPTPAPQIEGAKVVLMYSSAEFTEAHRNAITEKYGVLIEQLEDDSGRAAAMEAAGTPPDLFVAGGEGIGSEVVRQRVLALTPYVDTSTVFRWDDFSDCIRQNMFDGIQVGVGTLYCIPKDWSTDYTLFINTAAFEEAGLPVPSDEKPMTWQDVFAMLPQMVKTEGDRTLRWGFDNHYWPNALPLPEFLLEMLPQLDDAPPLYGEAFEKINLVNNPPVMEIMQIALDLAQKRVMPSSVDPLGTWFGQGFTQGQIAVLNTGYWFGGMAESETTTGKVMYLPAPLYGKPEKRRSSSLWTQGVAIHRKSKVPDAAWKVIEYFCGDEPARERARTGWGLPLLKSMYNLLPQDTPFNQQRYQVVMAELPYVGDPLEFNPFEARFIDEEGAWDKALAGKMALEEAITSIENSTNAVIQETIQRFM